MDRHSLRSSTIALVLAAIAALFGCSPGLSVAATPAGMILKADSYRHFIEAFNRGDRELYVPHISNARAWEFLSDNIPLLDCPDKELEEIYYFRWWTYRKHIKQTPEGFVITEFLPEVPWAGKYNTISCPVGHHLMEGRWLHDPRYLDDYARFWFQEESRLNGPGAYLTWPAWAIHHRTMVTGDATLDREVLDGWIQNYRRWEKGWRFETTHEGEKELLWKIGKRENGLFSIWDGWEGGELSIGGHGYRPLINSAMYGEATTIATVAAEMGQTNVADEFRAKAKRLKNLVETRLWDPEKQFFMILKDDGHTLSECRELNGYAPWYFNLPGADKAIAWKQLTDPQGFYAPFGPTFAEQRHPEFLVSYDGHECQWNGPSWPYATSIVLTALANLLDGSPQSAIGKAEYWKALQCYAHSQRFREIPPATDGEKPEARETSQPWIDENLNPKNGDWISRTILRQRRLKNSNLEESGRKEVGPEERGKDYNHSTFCDLIISGLIGLRPRGDDVVEVNPLLPEGTWDYFCLDRVRYHGHWLTIVYDKTGQHYGKGQGLRVFCDGREIAAADNLKRVTGSICR
jgi:hypothetical protein